MTQRVQHAINIFLDAINNGTLAAGTCTACAVGNLVADAIDCKITHNEDFYFSADKENYLWGHFIHGFKEDTHVSQKARNQLSKLDFTFDEIKAIEEAFERNTIIPYWSYKNNSPEQVRKDQINGLKAVVQVMLDFEESDKSVNEVFTNKAEAIPVN